MRPSLHRPHASEPVAAGVAPSETARRNPRSLAETARAYAEGRRQAVQDRRRRRKRLQSLGFQPWSH